MNYSIFIFLFLLVICFLIPFILKSKEGYESEENAFKSALVSMDKIENYLTTVETASKEAQTFAESASRSASRQEATINAQDASNASKEASDALKLAQTNYELISLKESLYPNSTNIIELKRRADIAMEKIKKMTSKAQSSSSDAALSINNPIQPSNNTRAPYSRVTNPSPMYEDVRPNDVYIPSNISAPLNTSAPMNTFMPLNTSMPLSTVTPLHVTSPPLNLATVSPMNRVTMSPMNLATVSPMNRVTMSPMNQVTISPMNTPAPTKKGKRTLDDVHDDNLNGEIERNKTFIDMIINMFTKFSEPFDSKVRITDLTNDKTYDLSSNYELYNVNGRIGSAKHDETNYKSILQAINNNYNRLNTQKTTKCEPIKCIADFDTDIGDNLCCGQPGTLKDTRYVCPINKPTCGNFKCGSKFGECS